MKIISFERLDHGAIAIVLFVLFVVFAPPVKAQLTTLNSVTDASGGSGFSPVTQGELNGGQEIGSGTQPLTVSNGGFTLTSYAFQEANSTVEFYYQIKNTAGSAHLYDLGINGFSLPPSNPSTLNLSVIDYTGTGTSTGGGTGISTSNTHLINGSTVYLNFDDITGGLATGATSDWIEITASPVSGEGTQLALVDDYSGGAQVQLSADGLGSLTLAPEPGTWLFGLALIGGVLVSRRRKTQPLESSVI